EEDAAAARGDAPAVPFEDGERGGGEAEDGAGDRVVADEQVVPAAEHPNWHLLRLAGGEDGAQFVHVARSDEELGRPADLQVRVRRERLVPLRDLGEVVR